MNLAAIDIGSNTLRLLVARPGPTGTLERLLYRQRMTRLLGGAKNGFQKDAIRNSLDTIAWFSDLVKVFPNSRCRIVATESLRSTPASQEFADAVASIAGTRLDLLSGAEEARLSTRGVFSACPPNSDVTLVFDLGGGSIEFSLCHSTRPVWTGSYPVGVVRLAEGRDAGMVPRLLARLRADLVTAGRWQQAVATSCSLVGTAGTMTTLASLHLQLPRYRPEFINGVRLSLQELMQLQSFLGNLSPAHRERQPGMEIGRADLVAGGLDCVLQLMRFLCKREVRVSDAGLLEGVLLELAEFN